MSLKQYEYYRTDLGVLYCGDSRLIIGHLEADTMITDPVWPNCTPVLQGSGDPYGLLESTLLCLNPSVTRLGIHLGGTSDPRFLTSVPIKFEFFRLVYLRFIKPAYIGRLLMTNDMAYLFGPPPKSKKGQHFMGSGTTAVGCEYFNRKWIGIEIEEKYCAIAKKRIEAERKQLKLF